MNPIRIKWVNKSSSGIHFPGPVASLDGTRKPLHNALKEKFIQKCKFSHYLLADGELGEVRDVMCH